MADAERWYWCLTHDRPEAESHVCRASGRLGPYESEAAARAWKERAENRNEDWEEEDEEWESWPDEEKKDASG